MIAIRVDRARRGMYRSSYGPTIDGLQKPEVIALGIWVAAPILLNTPTAAEAEFYSMLDAAADEDLRALIASRSGLDQDLDESRSLPIHLVRQLISVKLREGNLINQHYKYVDGTFVRRPIVSSIIACMLEANPRLSPQRIQTHSHRHGRTCSGSGGRSPGLGSGFGATRNETGAGVAAARS
jgi:serine protease AprX